MEKYGVVVERGVKAERVEQNEDGVTAWLKSSDSGGKEREVRCKYIVECDGAHGIVRKSAGMKYKRAHEMVAKRLSLHISRGWVHGGLFYEIYAFSIHYFETAGEV